MAYKRDITHDIANPGSNNAATWQSQCIAWVTMMVNELELAGISQTDDSGQIDYTVGSSFMPLVTQPASSIGSSFGYLMFKIYDNAYLKIELRDVSSNAGDGFLYPRIYFGTSTDGSGNLENEIPPSVTRFASGGSIAGSTWSSSPQRVLIYKSDTVCWFAIGNQKTNGSIPENYSLVCGLVSKSTDASGQLNNKFITFSHSSSITASAAESVIGTSGTSNAYNSTSIFKTTSVYDNSIYEEIDRSLKVPLVINSFVDSELNVYFIRGYTPLVDGKMEPNRGFVVADQNQLVDSQEVTLNTDIGPLKYKYVKQCLLKPTANNDLRTLMLWED